MPIAEIVSLAALSMSFAVGSPANHRSSVPKAIIVQVAADPCFDPPTRQARLACLNRPPVKMGIGVFAPDPPLHVGTASVHPATHEVPHADFPIHFTSGSAKLDTSAQNELAKIADTLTDPSLKGVRFRIEGHTDTVGTDAGNMALSDARAHSVVNYLSSKLNVPLDALEPVGVGKTQLIVETPDQTPDFHNRVVRIIRLSNG